MKEQYLYRKKVNYLSQFAVIDILLKISLIIKLSQKLKLNSIVCF